MVDTHEPAHGAEASAPGCMPAIELDGPGAPLRRARRARRRDRDASTQGRRWSVLGANGAGKTTLLRVLVRPAATARGRRRACSAPSCRASAGSCPAGSATSATSRCSTATSPGARTCATTRACTACGEARVGGAARRRGHGPPRGRAAAPSSRAGWCSGWPPRARCCTTRRCCCWTSRAPDLDPAGGRAARAADRPRLRPHARARDPRRGGRAGGGRPGGRPARTGARCWPAAVRCRTRRGRSTRDPHRGHDPAQGPAHRAAHEGVRAGDDAVRAHGLRAVPLRARPRLARRRAGVGRPVGDAAAGVGDRRDRLFAAEREQGGIDGLLLAPVDRTALFLAKAGALFLFLVARGAGGGAGLRAAAARPRPGRRAARAAR